MLLMTTATRLHGLFMVYVKSAKLLWLVGCSCRLRNLCMEEILLLNMIKNLVAEKNGNKMKILKQGAEAKPFFFVNTKIGKQFWCAKFPWKFERKKALRERKNNMQNLKEKMIIQQGAEAIIYRDGDKLIKERIPKGYRIKEIDDKIRKLRTRSEGKLLQKSENTPKVFLVDERNFKIE